MGWIVLDLRGYKCISGEGFGFRDLGCLGFWVKGLIRVYSGYNMVSPLQGWCFDFVVRGFGAGCSAPRASQVCRCSMLQG